jgi:GntR family transcriptional repressor for pyruvate dehydrogenase complex
VTLREAIRLLEAEGYVKPKRGGDAGLLLLPQSESLEVIRARVSERYEELQAVLEFRQATEAAAASLAAARRTDRDLDTAEATLEDLKRSRDMPAFRKADGAFHLAVAEAARNPWLREAIEEARAAMFLPLDVFDPSLPLTTSITQHLRILTAIRKGDSRGAERAMITHIQNTRRDLDDALSVTEKAT